MGIHESHISFFGELNFSSFLSLGHHVLILNTHDTAAPGSSEISIFIELSKEVLLKIIKILEVFLSNFSKSNASSSLSVNKFSKSSFSSNETERNILFSA